MTTTGIELVALRCSNCGAGLAGEPGSVFLFCRECKTGFQFTEKQELSPVKVYFAKTADNAEKFFPFWAFDAKLSLQERESKMRLFGKSKGLISVFEQRGALRFYVPAYDESWSSKNPVALQLTYNQPELSFVSSRDEITGFVHTEQDARRIADYLFITSEIEQKDTLRNLQYKLTLENPIVIVIGLP